LFIVGRAEVCNELMFLAHSLCNKHRFAAHSQAGKDRLLAIEPPPLKPDKAPPRIVIFLLVPCCSQQVGDWIANALDADRDLLRAELDLRQIKLNELLSVVQLFYGVGAERLVKVFNDKFRALAEFKGLESGYVFDTNVYTQAVYELFSREELAGRALGIATASFLPRSAPEIRL